MSSKIFYLISVIVVIALTFILKGFKKPTLPKIIIGITTIGYSLISDILFGEIFNLFYYISKEESIIYTILSAIFIYPFLNILYVAYLPEDKSNVIPYTSAWIVALLVFEYITVITKTIVFTGWQPFPWSIITYIVAYTWIYLFYKYLLKKII